MEDAHRAAVLFVGKANGYSLTSYVHEPPKGLHEEVTGAGVMHFTGPVESVTMLLFVKYSLKCAGPVELPLASPPIILRNRYL